MHRWLVAVAMLAAFPVSATDVPSGPLPAGVVPAHYRLRLHIDPRQQQFSGRADIDVTVRAPQRTVWLHGLDLKMSRVTVSSHGKVLAAHYQEVDHDSGVARIDTDTPIPAGKATLRFTYTAPFQSSPQGLYRTQAGADWYAFSQMEAIDARRVFPGFDEPRFKTPFDVTLVTAASDLAITNTPEQKAVRNEHGATAHTYLTTRPLPTYLLTFAVGPLTVLAGPPVPPNAVRHEPLPLRLIGTRQGEAARFRFALNEAPDIIARLEQYFGIPFPYPKIDLIASPIHPGAMENAGAIVFGEELLAFGPQPTPRQQSSFGEVAAHELAHQWFGDLVTPAWWDDIWLNEAFAEWMGSKISDQWRPQLGIDKEQLDSTLGAMHLDALSAGRAIHQPLARNSEIGAAFDNITYDKGAGVIGMVESYLGADRFQRGVRLHLQRHAYGTATATQFFAAMAEASGEPAIIEAFRSFVDQPGLPLVRVSRAGDGSLALEQSRYHALGSRAATDSPPWQIPFCADFYGAGAPLKSCTMLTGKSGTLPIPAGARDRIVHPNAAGAGYYRFAAEPALLDPLFEMAVRLPPREALTLADSVGAAFDAGRLPFAGLYQAAQRLATHPDRTAALSLGLRLDALYGHLADAAERPLLERALGSLYGERLRALGYDATPGRYGSDPAEQQLLRRELIGVLGLGARDPQLRASLTGAAEHSVGDPSAVEELFRWRVWAVGLQERGAPLLEPLKKLATDSPDAQVRADAGAALSYAPVALSEAALDFSLEPRLEIDSALRIVFQQMADPHSRGATWKWLGAHRDAVIARVPAAFQGFLARLGNSFCSAEERESFNQVLGSRLRTASGGEIEVDRALESIDDCIALRAALGDSIRTTLEQQLPR